MKRPTFIAIGVGAILLMALVAVLLSRNNQPDSPNTPNATNGQDSGGGTKSEVKIYQISVSNTANSDTLVGCNDGLVERRVLIDGLNNDIKAAYTQQLALGKAVEPGLYNALAQSNLKLEDVRIEGSTALVNLSGELVTIDACDRARARAQLEYPARQFSGVEDVVVRINGYLLEELFR